MKKQEIIACCGGGTIGSGFAVNFAMAGYTVRVLEINETAAQTTQNTINDIFYFFSSEVGTPIGEIEKAKEKITVTTDAREAYTGVSMVQECGPENYEIKASIISVIDEYAPKDAVYASSTSGLLVSRLAEYSKYPERVIGAHPYHPAYLIPLVEITKTPATRQKYVDKAVEIFRASGKEPVVLQKDVVGFIANRLSHAVLRETVSLVKNGICTVEDVDKAMVFGPGMRWSVVGPVMVGELLSPNGTREGTERFRATNNRIFQDLENVQELPEDWGDVAQAGVDIEKNNLADYYGRSKEDIAQFRDKVLLELLRLHKKI